jgi:hypothetical protein
LAYQAAVPSICIVMDVQQRRLQEIARQREPRHSAAGGFAIVAI